MNVKNWEVYHIHRFGPGSERWRPGAVIFWGQKQINRFNSYYDTFQLRTTDTPDGKARFLRDALARCLAQDDAWLLAHSRALLTLSHEYLKDLTMFLRETVFEEVRANYFPHLPSRRTGIWLVERDAVNYWWQQLGGEKKILRLQVTGVVHRGDARYLTNDTFSLNQYRTNAFHYWTGTDGLSPKEPELLFEGVISVLDEYCDLEDLKQRSEG